MSFSRKCRKFQSLYVQKLTGGLNPAQQLFLLHHQQKCPECQKLEHEIQQAQRLLKQKEILCAPSPDLHKRILKALRKDRLRRQLQVWKPTLIGAGITAIAIASALQVLMTEIPFNSTPTGMVNRESLPQNQGGNHLFVPDTKQKEPSSVEG